MDSYSLTVPQSNGQVRDQAPSTYSVGSSLKVSIGLATAVFVAYVALTSSRFGGPGLASWVDNLGLLAIQLVAAATLFVAGRSSVKLRGAWWLLCGAVAGAAIRQSILSADDLVFRTGAPVPLAGDLASLFGLVLAIGAVLAFPSAPGRGTNRLRVLVNGALIAVAQFFIAWVVWLGGVYQSAQLPPQRELVSVGSLALEIIMLTVLLQAIVRATGALRRALIFLDAALILQALATAGAAVLVAAPHSFGLDERMLDLGFAAAYLMIAVTTRWSRVDEAMVKEEKPVATWMVITPGAFLSALVLTLVVMRLTNHPIDTSPVPLALAGALVVLLTASQILTHRDSMSLLRDSRRTASQLRERTTLLAEVYTNDPTGIARVATNDLRVIDMNPSFCRLVGLDSPAVYGAPITRFLGEASIRAALGVVDQTSDAAPAMESELIRADRTALWVKWTLTPVGIPEDAPSYYLVVIEDIEQKHQAELAAAANIAALDRLNRLKSEFVTLVAHEFRTALTGIQGFSELMWRDDLDPSDVKQFSQDIFKDAQRLTRMINEFLDLDRMEGSKMSIQVTSVDLQRIVAEVREQTQTTTSRHQIKVDLDGSLAPVAGDPNRIAEVLTNLLSNAIKHSPAGGDITIKTRAVGANAEVSVQDHGIGIPIETMGKLFDGYEKSIRDGISRLTGAGLRLVMARHIVESLGGRIWAESTVNVGSTFHFTIPFFSGAAGSPQVEQSTLAVDPSYRTSLGERVA
jgi:PAS domain S-box-containing protein